MASGLPSNPSLVQKLLSPLMGKMGSQDKGSGPMDRLARLGLSPRQQELNRLWAWYRCANYEVRAQDWNGKPHLDPLALEAVSSRGFIPPGFYDAAGQGMPLKFRRPTAPYALPKVIVDRFSGLLFSERQHPHVHVEGDTDTEDFLQALAEVSRLWSCMIQARQYGGAMGTVVVGFQFIDGKPVIEVHDPRWIWPEFEDRQALRLASFEKRYQFPVEERDPVTGKYDTVWYWYRRVIDADRDTLYAPAPVGKGEEPQWVVQAEVTHGLGFCPAIWVQNLPVQDSLDGDPDCHGIFEMVETIDALIAQANKGTLNNCDPTLGLVTKAEMGSEIKKGSDNSIKIPEGSMQYLEITGGGLKMASELAETLRKYALEVAQCVLEHPDAGNRTATEVHRTYAMMLAKADVLREQYGEKCVKPLLEMMVKAAQALGQPKPGEGEQAGVMVRQVLKLPDKVTKNPDGTMTKTPRQLGPGGFIKLQWPNYFEPSLQDVLQASQAAGTAKQMELIDAEHASKFVSEYFDVEDVQAMLAVIKSDSAQAQAEMEGMAMGGMGKQTMDEQIQNELHPFGKATPPTTEPGQIK